MNTVVLATHTAALFAEAVERAAELLRAGQLVALPTETVYGLAANAWDAAAVARIYEVKGRPARNPIIVHVAGLELARECVAMWPPVADKLAGPSGQARSPWFCPARRESRMWLPPAARRWACAGPRIHLFRRSSAPVVFPWPPPAPIRPVKFPRPMPGMCKKPLPVKSPSSWMAARRKWAWSPPCWTWPPRGRACCVPA